MKSHGAVGNREHFRNLSAAHLGIVVKRDDGTLAWRQSIQGPHHVDFNETLGRLGGSRDFESELLVATL
ncbi:MAG: hypothetical protein WB757_11240, partial [Candidatus Cybelea sp.]